MASNGTILIVDDQKDLALRVQRSLEDAGFDVIIAVDGTTGLQIAKEHRPDLVLLDLTLPDIDGLQVCETLRRDLKAGAVPIIVLSARASEADRVRGLDRGADDYLIKPFNTQELLARVRAALRRAAMPRSGLSVVRSGELAIDLRSCHVTCGNKTVSLRHAEYRVLEALAREPGRVFSRDEIIDGALRRDSSVTERTIDVHITRLRQTLGTAGEAMETVKGIGYRLRKEP